jgi:TonB family protein
MANPSSSPSRAGATSGAVAVLSSDADLLAAAQRATGREHELLTVSSETDLGSQLVSGKAGAVLIDSAAVHEPIDVFADRLKKQFPDLVLVVAGGPDDQTRLSKQITSGVVYRFLHRPVSEQRIRLFLEAALRRHDVEHAEHASAPPPAAAAAAKRPVKPNLPLLAGGALALLLVVGGIWFALRGEQEPQAVAPPPAAQDAATTTSARIAALLAEADAAYAKGDWVSPDGASAADKYRAVLALDASNSRARTGLDLVLDKLLSEAESALRGALTRARENARTSAGNEQAAAFLRSANQRLRSGNLVEPAEDNARFYIEAARGLTPDDPAIARLTRSLQTAMLERARAAATQGNAGDAEFWLANAQEAGAARTAVTDIRRTLQQTQVTARADNITRLTQSFQQALAADRLVAPEGDSAKSYWRALADADVAHPATVQGRQSLGAEIVREARIALGRNDLSGTEKWLAHARDIGFSNDELAATARDLAAARSRAVGSAPAATQTGPRGTGVVAASVLERTQYFAPRYPTNARDRGTAGWVDLEFTVQTDGSVADVTAIAAEPVGVFEQAAIGAVRRWRYRPVIVDGAPVEQRVRLRLRFELQE